MERISARASKDGEVRILLTVDDKPTTTALKCTISFALNRWPTMSTSRTAAKPFTCKASTNTQYQPAPACRADYVASSTYGAGCWPTLVLRVLARRSSDPHRARLTRHNHCVLPRRRIRRRRALGIVGSLFPLELLAEGGVALLHPAMNRKSGKEEDPVKMQLISGLSAIALLAAAGIAVAQDKGGASPGNAGTGEMERASKPWRRAGKPRWPHVGEGRCV